MSPLDIAAFAAPISFIIAIFSGLSGMAVDAVTDLAIFSARTSHHGSGSGGGGDGGCQEGSHRKNQAFHSNLPGERRPFRQSENELQQNWFQGELSASFALLVVTLLFTCSGDVLVLHLCKEPSIAGRGPQMRPSCTPRHPMAEDKCDWLHSSPANGNGILSLV